MGTTYTRPVTGGTPTTGQVVKAVHVNEPVDQIYDTILAGGITDSQLASSSVTTAKLATAAVTAAKMDGTLPDESAMATSAAPTTDKQLANKKYVDDEIAPAAAVVKAWVRVTSLGAIVGSGYNVASTSKTSTGTYTVSWDTDFADVNYAVTANALGGNSTARFCSVDDVLVSSCTITVRSAVSGDKADNAFMVTAIGEQ